MPTSLGMMNLSVASILVVGSLVYASAAGCHSQEPVSPAAGLTAPTDPPKQPDLGRYPDRVSVEVLNMYWGESVFSICKGPAPFFEFDSAKVAATDKPTIQMLSNCMADGALRGKNIELIGRTDPRGSEEYNEELGLARAQRVKDYLVAQGIPEGRIKVSSLGRQDASPSPKDWPADRRVEIRLAQ